MLQGSPSRCGRREIWGVSQVEKGDAGKTHAPLFGVKMTSKSNESRVTVLAKKSKE